MALGVVAVAIALPLLPIGHWFGFVAPPPLRFAYLAGATLVYLALVEIVKALFYRAIAGRSLQGHRGQH
jgi:Mg2+-importing ATPase